MSTSRKRRQRKSIRVEQLEPRQLLAADALQQNPLDPLDVNNDSFVTPLDALELVNSLQGDRRDDSGRSDNDNQRQLFMDVNGDRNLSPMDALLVINGMRERDMQRERRDKRPLEDPPTQEFASVDGTDNNLDNPELGSTGEALERWFAPDYVDGAGEPNAGTSPRSISNIVNASPGDTANARGLSDITWLFGQFIDHDITLSAEGHTESYPIEVPQGDPEFDPFGSGTVTIDFTRSDYEVDETGVRQQVNLISAFVDGSVIYGSDQQRADALRTFEDGMLSTSDGDLLPFNNFGLTNAGGPGSSLFLAGDIRANENAALAAMHTVWVREHNRLAGEIARDNPTLGDEEIYQRARQLVTAELQAITYNEFLPALLGSDAIPEYRGYDSSVNPNISNAFATAAYRFGHTMLSPQLLRLNSDGTDAAEGHLALQDAFFNTSALTDHGIDSILLGATAQTAQEVDPYLVDDVRNFLFGPPGAGGFDLASLNIQRGRDHGLPSYNEIRQELGLEVATSFEDISSDPEIQSRLAQAYANVDAVDAWVGMLAEDHQVGSSLGATAGAVIAEQFRVLRDGDRFYYENVFSGSDLRDIERTTLADVIERNTGLDFGRDQNVFFAEDIRDSNNGGNRRSRGFASATLPVDQALFEMNDEDQFI